MNQYKQLQVNSLKPKLVVNCGSMFSGKSTALISQGQRHSLAGHRTVFLKPSMDTRYSIDEINTHNHLGVPAACVDSQRSIIEVPEVAKSEVILIDEIQFFNYSLIVDDVKFLLEEGKIIIVSGLDLDFEGKPFEITMELMAYADIVNKFNAVCGYCGDNAWVSAKHSGGGSRIQLGGSDTYVPLCRTCFEAFKLKNSMSDSFNHDIKTIQKIKKG